MIDSLMLRCPCARPYVEKTMVQLYLRSLIVRILTSIVVRKCKTIDNFNAKRLGSDEDNYILWICFVSGNASKIF